MLLCKEAEPKLYPPLRDVAGGFLSKETAPSPNLGWKCVNQTVLGSELISFFVKLLYFIFFIFINRQYKSVLLLKPHPEPDFVYLLIFGNFSALCLFHLLSVLFYFILKIYAAVSMPARAAVCQ